MFFVSKDAGGQQTGGWGHGIHSRKLTAVPWTWMVGSDVFSYWNSPFKKWTWIVLQRCFVNIPVWILDPHRTSDDEDDWGVLFFTENSGCFRKEWLFPPPKKNNFSLGFSINYKPSILWYCTYFWISTYMILYQLESRSKKQPLESG